MDKKENTLINGEDLIADTNLVEMNLYREDYQLEEVLGQITFDNEILDYIADKCVQMVLRDYGKSNDNLR